MTFTDPIGDMFSRIRNGQMRNLNSVEIPSSKQPGDSTSAILTLCIGSGIEEICEEFDVTIFASNTATNIPHIRTVPTSGLIWDIETNYDGSTKSWDMSSAGMLKVGWKD